MLCNSFVYVISVVTTRSQGYALSPQVPTLAHHEQGSDSPAETATSGQAQQHQSPQSPIPSGYPNLMFPQVPHGTFIPFQVPNFNLIHREMGTDPNVAGFQLEAQEKFLRHQIEVKCLALSACHIVSLLWLGTISNHELYCY